MKSYTKFEIDDDTIKKLMKKAGFHCVESIAPLTAGEFNSAYFVCADGKELVLKISPKKGVNVLTYEQNIMKREIEFYEIIERSTSVKTPKIYYYDDSADIIDAEYFIMEKLSSKPLTDVKLNSEQRKEVLLKIGEMVAELHNIKGEKFGYVQNGLYDNWYEAVRSMTLNLIADCKKLGKKAENGEKLIKYIDKYKDVLMNVSSTYTHFDIWDGNIFYENNGEITLTLIDTERSFWGDRIGDFVSIDMMRDLENKKEIIKGYNAIAKAPLSLSDDEKIRYYILLGYLALIVHSEKYVRYSVLQSKYIVNSVFERTLFKRAFKGLGKL